MKLFTSMLKTAQRSKFSWQTTAKYHQLNHYKTLVINHNLRLDADDLDLFVIPSHPKVIAKSPNFLQIDTTVPVLELLFISKKFRLQNKVEAWTQRMIFYFNFNHLQKLLDLQTNTGFSERIERTNIQGKNITYSIVDMKEKSQIKFGYSETIQKKDSKHQKLNFAASIPYSELQILQDIIKESLYDLSGLPFIFEQRKREQVAAVTKSINATKNKQEEIKSYFG